MSGIAGVATRYVEPRPHPTRGFWYAVNFDGYVVPCASWQDARMMLEHFIDGTLSPDEFMCVQKQVRS
jgi:hypothetical protein